MPLQTVRQAASLTEINSSIIYCMKIFIYVFILIAAVGFLLCTLYACKNTCVYAVYNVYTVFELHGIVMLHQINIEEGNCRYF